jgi:hypothetical protein
LVARASSNYASGPDRSPHIALMAEKLQSEHGKAAYRKRKWIAEPPNG